MKQKTVIYIHGKGGNVAEAEHYKQLFPDCEVIGLDYKAQTPWEAEKEFAEYFDEFAELGHRSTSATYGSIPSDGACQRRFFTVRMTISPHSGRSPISLVGLEPRLR